MNLGKLFAKAKKAAKSPVGRMVLAIVTPVAVREARKLIKTKKKRDVG